MVASAGRVIRLALSVCVAAWAVCPGAACDRQPPATVEMRLGSGDHHRFVAETASELRDTLRAAHEVNEFVIIEARVPHDDISPISKRYIRESIKKAKAA